MCDDRVSFDTSSENLEDDDVSQMNSRIKDLEQKVKFLEEENQRLRMASPDACAPLLTERLHETGSFTSDLTREEIERYSRQILVDDHGFGVHGQIQLRHAAVLVVGAGGIGSTVLLYLAGAGVGRLGVIDFDVVDVTNLHRQIIHGMSTVGQNKADSAQKTILNLNPSVECHILTVPMSAENAVQLIEDYDIVVDATDNPLSRYTINDACVLLGKPLVSGSAVGTQGQLTIHNWKNSACYRCLYPNPSIQAGCQSCSDAGVLGPVPGLIGVLQAMETLKLLTGCGTTMEDRLLMYDGATCSFLLVKKPPKRKACSVCGTNPTITSMIDSYDDLSNVRGPSSSCVVAATSEGCDVTCQEYFKLRSQGQPHVLLDVRVERQFEMCALPGAINIPLQELPMQIEHVAELSGGTKPVFVLCRRGVASAEAVQMIHRLRQDDQNRRSLNDIHSIRNVVGGLVAWQRQVDPSFPIY
jgi:adenylyltransferase and sulfurtransferase